MMNNYRNIIQSGRVRIVNRKIISVLLVSFIVLSLTGCKFNRNTRINKRNFPDAAFADYVKTFDSDNDGKLSQAECEAVDSVRLEGISDPKGLELFPNITYLELANCYIKEFEFGSFQNLKCLYVIGYSSFKKIDLSKNNNLEEFTYYQNNINATLEELILPQNKSLKKIRDLKGVTKATHSMSILTDLDDDEKDENHSDIQLTTISSTANQKPVSVKGKAYDKKAYGIWLDKTFADKHNLKVGDKIKISYGKLPEATVKIKGLVMSPEYIYYTAIATQTMPDYQKHGYGYVSEKQMEKITGMIYYNQIRINTTKNCNLDKLEEKAEDVLGDKFYSLQTHDDNKSTFQMKDEIDQTKRMATMFTFVFILLALLTMYTTMSRLVKNQMIWRTLEMDCVSIM